MTNIKEVSTVKLEKYGIEFGNFEQLVLIGGPCVIESREVVFEVCEKLKAICSRVGVKYIFKASFDKANRSSIHSYRGPGIDEGLEILKEVKEKFNVPVLTDIHEPNQVEKVAKVVDIMQIPAFLCRQTDLLVEAAKSGCIVNVKKGQFLSGPDMKNVVKKIEEGGCTNILLTERGNSFGYQNLVVDMRNLIEMREFNYPIVFDATHSVQRPGGFGNSSSGNSEYAPFLMNGALAVGVDAIFAEIHPNPKEALCDGANMINLDDIEEILIQAKQINSIVKK